MNKFIRLVRENLLPSIAFAILAVSCGSAWYFLHPSSPYHPRYSFVVSYQEVGTLSPGNPVEIRGIKAGEITKVQLTEDAVYVTARVYSSFKIPVNSEFRLINSGLMGEREMCVLTGDSDKLVADGDTLQGKYDAGTSGVFKSLEAAFNDLFEIKDSLNALIDSVTVGSTGKQIVRIVDKGKKIIQVSKSDFKSWIGDVENLFGELDRSLTQVKATLDDVASRAGTKVDEVKPLLERVDKTLGQVKDMKGQAEGLLAKVSDENGSVGAVLDENGQFGKDVDRTLKDVDALISDIKKSGLKMNVDIF
ncbi:MAG: MlaD family protein [Fibrobacter sp.]|nr:MlaD family protein [Fibrobacter sp.]